MKFLYAEQAQATETVVNILRYHGHTVDNVHDAEAALAFALAENYDAIILDCSLQKTNGEDMLDKLREKGRQTPVLILSEEPVSWKECTNITRYLAKPFALGEFLAHLRTLCPSPNDIFPSSLCFGDIMLNIHNSTLSGKDRSINLPKMECRMLELLIFNNGTYISTEEILAHVWGEDSPAEIGIVWVYISYLRKKLALLSGKVKIKGKRNIGYTLEATA